MDMTGVNQYTNNYKGQTVSEYASKVEESERTDKVSGEETTAKTEKESVVYEKSSETDTKAAYSINKMSPEERASLVEQLKSDQRMRQQQLVDIVRKMITNQNDTYGKANNSIFTSDVRAQAQKDIAEDGYYGVKQTSERLFDFACALAGDDVEKMKQMQAAMEKGYKQAEKKCGGSLPGICQSTLAAANKLFDEYYASKESKTE